jgi:plastocyanin
MHSKAIFSFAILITLALSVAAHAGSISGTVSGVHGASVVYLEAPAGKTYPAPAKSVTIDQRGMHFQPHVVVVQVGTTVDFLNSDSVAHNVFWPSISGNKALAHNLGTWPQGEKKSFKFDHPGVLALLCNVHPDMSGYLVVSPTPYYAETDAAGNYTIKDVPDGQYTVTAWHEGGKPQGQKVAVAGDTKANIALK